jgi:hypothetical protein
MLGPFDTLMEVIVTETDPVTGLTNVTPYMAPHPNFAHNLIGDRYYNIAYRYEALVNFGVDPPYANQYSYTLGYSSVWVPEPAAFGLILIGLAWLSLARRRPKSAGATR